MASLGQAYPQNAKVPFKRKTWGFWPKSHMIFIEINKEARYLKKNSQAPQEKKTAKLKPIQHILLLGQ